MRRSKRHSDSTPSAVTPNKKMVVKKLEKTPTLTEEQVMDGENHTTYSEHVAAMKKELAKPKNKNLALIKELMEATYKIRHKSILESPTKLDILLAEYPALKLVSEVGQTSTYI